VLSAHKCLALVAEAVEDSQQPVFVRKTFPALLNVVSNTQVTLLNSTVQYSTVRQTAQYSGQNSTVQHAAQCCHSLPLSKSTVHYKEAFPLPSLFMLAGLPAAARAGALQVVHACIVPWGSCGASTR